MEMPREVSLLRRMVAARVKRLVAGGPVLSVSLVEIAKHCGRSGCRCQPARRGGRGEKHVGHYLTYKTAGKTRTVYVPLSQLEEVRAWHDEARRMRDLMGECSQLCLALVRRRAELARELRTRVRSRPSRHTRLRRPQEHRLAHARKLPPREPPPRSLRPPPRRTHPNPPK